VETWSLIIVETLAHDRLLQDMKGLQGSSRFPRGNTRGSNQPRKKANLDFAFPRLRNFRAAYSHLVDLLVKERREKKELRMAEPESRATLGEPSFSQDDALFPATHRLADSGPLL
jgi:hypothetical protein